MQRPLNLLILAVVTAMTTLAALPTASAHASATSDDGKIKVTWGWTDEPATTHAKNGLDLVLRYADNDTGVMGAHEAGLQVELRYGDEVLTLEAIQPQHGREADGRYTGLHPITPSQSGLYTLHLSGTLNGSAIDVTIPATHEVQGIEETYFPPASGTDGGSGGDTSALESRIAALEAKVAALEAKAQTQSEQTPTPTTRTGGGGGDTSNGIPSAGFVGLLVASVAAVALASAFRRRGE